MDGYRGFCNSTTVTDADAPTGSWLAKVIGVPEPFSEVG